MNIFEDIGDYVPLQPRRLGTRSGRDTGNGSVIAKETETVTGSGNGSGSGSGTEREKKRRRGTATLRSRKWMMSLWMLTKDPDLPRN